MAHWLSCHFACGMFLKQGSNSCPLHWQVDCQLLTTRESPFLMNFPKVSFKLVILMTNSLNFFFENGFVFLIFPNCAC